MKKSETEKAQKTAAKGSAKSKVTKGANVAAPAPEATTGMAAAPIAAPATTERDGAAKTGAQAKKGAKVKKMPKAEKRPSGLDAAAQVLKDAGQPMNTKTMVEQMLAKGMWKTGGKTPAATIYAAILREIQVKGEKARFKKTDRGLFTLSA